MAKRDLLTKVLAVIGTVFVWLPLLAPILFSIMLFIQRRRFRFDYLMPAELFPLILLGGGLLIWASLRAHSQRRIIIWSYSVAIGVLVLGQVIAVTTGLASGEIEPAGLWWVLVIGSLAGYSLALIVLGVGGAALLGGLFKKPNLPVTD